jgi:hypothetical protein
MAENVKITISAIDKTKKGFGSVGRALGGLTKSIFSMRTALVGVAGAAGFGLLVRSSLNATDSLAKTASKIGTTTEALSGLRFAAEITGVATTTMDMALQRFTRRTAEAAKGTGEAKGALQALGINATKLIDLPLDERMLVLADAFAKQTNESQKLALAFKLFDSEGAALVNTLSLGREGLSELLGEARALGVVMSSSAAKGVENATDSLTKLKAITKGLRDQFVAALAPAIESLTTQFTDFFKEIAEKKGGVEQFAKDMAKAFLNASLVVVTSLDTILTNVGLTFQAFRENIQKFREAVNKFEISALERKINRLQEALDIVMPGNGQEPQELSFLQRIKFGVKTSTPTELDIATLALPIQKELDTLRAKLGETLTPIDLSNVIDVVGFEKTINSLIAIIDGGGDGKGLTKTVTESVSKIRQTFLDWQDSLGDVDLALQDVAKKGMNQFTDAFTDAITGAKNFASAMKDMAKSVVDSLIKMLVQYYITKPLFDAITGSFGGQSSSNIEGSANFVGPTLPSLNGGGFTGYGSRSGGVDGKGGFPAILHPNETVIDHTKGQSSGVVVQQTINVTTGVQQTVRAEIVQLMPQIAQAAKGAVADARLRGGNFSKAMAGA